MDPVPPWVPEDDLLLKNAVEAGASLESLAKGAVRFSRRYSVAELRDRWRSLLYDDDVSAVAAAAMANLELAKSGAGTVGSGEGGGKKRKVQSIRKQYHAMQKRLRRHWHGVASSDVKNAVGCEGKESVVIDDNLNSNNDSVNNNLVGCGNCSVLEGVGVGVGQLNNSVSEVSQWNTIDDVSLPDMPGVGGKSCGGCGNGVLKSNAPDAVLGEGATNASGCLLNLVNEDELLFMNVEGKEVAAADNVDSLLLSSPCDVQGDGDVCETQKLDVETKLAAPSGCSSARLEVVGNPLGSSCGDDQHFVFDSENDTGSSAAACSPHPEDSERFMVCVLNTEDSDIPSNDSADVSIVVPHLVVLKSLPIVKELGYSESAINNQRRNEPDGSLKKEAVLSQSFAASQTVRQGLVPNVNSSYPPVVLALKTENPGRNSMSAVSRQNNGVNVNVNPSHGRLVHATVMPASDGHLKQEEIDAPVSAEVYAHVKAEEHKALSKSEAKSLSLDQEGGDIDDEDDNDGNDDNNDNDDNDDEIPNFSDAETMILEMDLCPTDQDTKASREVLRYQHEESKRTIMRLEQGAQSSMGRAITSRGAFAVVYGRILKKYIRKSKVILGRATHDVHVDIDLGKEGQAAKKISRRQALIKLEANGSFIIKNLGKRSIFLNGKEIATGQARGLSASSVIEIRGISLIFEINNRCVRRFLENVNEKL
ncbi:Microspherule protein 1 [Spatholobus suberectus]|nr:Microspherule protein 1 [Spatholobus suberectus]